MKFPSQGLYAITYTDQQTDVTVINAVTAAIQGGAMAIQYRNKQNPNNIALATQLLTICQAAKIPLIINDNVNLAAQINADGVHLGQTDGNISAAREILGADKIIGVSCYNDVDYAQQASNASADYVAFGRFFTSSSKPLATAASLDSLTQARAKINLPIVAIGGILPENGKQLLQAGATVLAVIAGVFQQENIQTAANKYQKLFVK